MFRLGSPVGALISNSLPDELNGIVYRLLTRSIVSKYGIIWKVEGAVSVPDNKNTYR